MVYLVKPPHMKKLLFIAILLCSFLSLSQEETPSSKHNQFVKYKLAELQNFRTRKSQKRKKRRAKLVKSGAIPIVKMGFQSLIGFNNRILRPTSFYSYDKVNDRNSIEEGSYAASIEYLIHYTTKRTQWFELVTGIGFESTEIKNNSKSHFFMINQGLNFLIGKKAHKAVISMGSYFTLTNNSTRIQYYSSFREKYTSLNISPYFSVGFLHQSIKSNNVSVQLFFKCQIKNHIEGNRYYEGLPQNDPFLSEHDVPNYTTHSPENEYQWQTGVKLAYLFNVSK